MSEYSIALEKQLEAQRFQIRESSLRKEAALSQVDVFVVASLEASEPFFVSRSIGALLAGAAETMPDWSLDRDALFAHRGFLWFEDMVRLPESMIDEHGELVKAAGDLSAVGWGELHCDGEYKYYVPTPLRPANQTAVFSYCSVDFPEFPPRVPLMNHFWSWPHGYPMSRVLEEGAMNHLDRKLGVSPRAEMILRVWASAVQFMQQRLLTTVRERPSRATRRRLEARMAHEAMINVVQLRRRAHVSHSPDANRAEVDYSCQWLVRGHWRQQWYPKLGRHQPKWITPYVKGPDDKPLKQPRATVFAVVR